jgi:hypothetical protein
VRGDVRRRVRPPCVVRVVGFGVQAAVRRMAAHRAVAVRRLSVRNRSVGAPDHSRERRATSDTRDRERAEANKTRPTQPPRWR